MENTRLGFSVPRVETNGSRGERHDDNQEAVIAALFPPLLISIKRHIPRVSALYFVAGRC